MPSGRVGSNRFDSSPTVGRLRTRSPSVATTTPRVFGPSPATTSDDETDVEGAVDETAAAGRDGDETWPLDVELDGAGTGSAMPAGPAEAHPTSTVRAAAMAPTVNACPGAGTVRCGTVRALEV